MKAARGAVRRSSSRIGQLFETCRSTPAIGAGKLLIRTQSKLFAIQGK